MKKIFLLCSLLLFSLSLQADYKITFSSQKLSVPEQEGISGEIIAGDVYTFNKRGALYYSESLNGMIFGTEFYHLGYSNLSWFDLYTLDNDETGAKTRIINEEFEHGNDNPGVVNHITEQNGIVYVDSVNTSGDYSLLFPVYPYFKAHEADAYGLYESYTFYTDVGKFGILLNDNRTTRIFYPDASYEQTVDIDFNNAYYNKNVDVMALYGYPEVRAMKSDGSVLWSKHIINDLELNQNPSLSVVGDGVLVQYGTVVKKVDFSGNIKDFIDFSETDYPNATIKGSYFNHKNNRLYFFTNYGKVGIMN
jgi:hypothetical protein